MTDSRRQFLKQGLGMASSIAFTRPPVFALEGGERSEDSQHPGKRAFAHYMVGQGTRRKGQSVGEWKDDIRDALSVGLDGWQLNFGFFRARFVKDVDFFIRALEELGDEGRDFKFFPSFDCNKGREPRVGEVLDWFSRYYSHPNHYRLNGYPLLTVWQARDVGNSYFANLKRELDDARMPIAFVPWLAVRPSAIEMEWLFNQWPSMDGFFPWIPGRRSQDAVRFNKLADDLCRRYGKTLFAGQGYGLLPINKAPRYIDYHAGEAVTTQFAPLLDGSLPDCRHIIFATWNDFGEEHHITPHPPWGPVWGKHRLWCHEGYSFLVRHYLQWWKSGRAPEVNVDSMAIFHLTQPAKEGRPPFPYADYSPDKATDTVYVSALLKLPGRVFIKSGGASPISFDAPAGISHWRAPAAIGEQVFGLARGGELVIEHTSAREIRAPGKDWSWGLYTEAVSL